MSAEPKDEGAVVGEQPAEPDEDLPPSTAEDEAMRRLLKRALPGPTHEPPPQEFLREVQTKIRTRSRGKFFADGWSTSTRRLGYGAVAMVMLLVLLLAFVLTTPRSFGP